MVTRPKATRPPDITEKAFQGQVQQLARTLGWDDYHTFNAYRSRKGFPDLVLWHAHQRRIIFAELKSETGKPTPAQVGVLDGLREAGGEAYLWRPSDWDEIVETLRTRGRTDNG